MAVRAKFKVSKKTTDGDGAKVELMPVAGGSPENDKFFKQTPAGRIELSTINADAAKQFEEGKEVYVDFTPVNK